jgi:pimeloyl-ACP methyl ester carboxylesterase
MIRILLSFWVGTFPLLGMAQTFWREEPLVLRSNPAPLHATLTVPKSNKPCQLVILVPGSGPTDRNCNSATGLKTDAFRYLAHDLALAGVASLRYDKRGIGESKAALIREDDLRFEQNVTDLLAWMDLVRLDKRFSGLVLAGHSEGSLISILAAKQSTVDGLISLAGPGRPAPDLLKEQLKPRLSPEDWTITGKLLDSLSAGLRVKQSSPKLKELFRPSVLEYLISWFQYDPAREFSSLTCPALIIQGAKDVQVSVLDAELLKAAMPRAEWMLIPTMDHVLKRFSPKDRPSQVENYVNPRLPLHPDLVPAILRFLASLP